MIKTLIDGFISQLNSQRESKVNIACQKARQEQILPFFTEMNNALQSAIDALTVKYNEDLAKLQKDFESEKARLTEANSTKKADYEKAILASETEKVNKEFADAVKTLTELSNKTEG